MKLAELNQLTNQQRTERFTKEWTDRKSEVEYLYREADLSQQQLAEYFNTHLSTIQKAMNLSAISVNSSLLNSSLGLPKLISLI